MISVSNVLEELIEKYPFLEEGISRGIINFSALSRELKPQIEKRLCKKIKTGAIIVSLKRLGKKNIKDKISKYGQIKLTDLTVKSDLIEITFSNSSNLLEKQKTLLGELSKIKDIFCVFTNGVRETTFILSSSIESLVKKIFVSEILVGDIKNLSAVSIKLPLKTIKTPGVYYQILKALAWENINVIEVLSTCTEIMIVFYDREIDKAFSVLKNLGKV